MATLVIRRSPPGLLSVLGRFDDVLTIRLHQLAWRLRHSPPLHVDYQQAERDCATLAIRLQEHWSTEELRTFSWLGLPRGGLFVLGMLAYVLDLPPSALRPPTPGESTVVVVDDCALTGMRFAQFLAGGHIPPGASVVFAHLYSHPALREEIIDREPAVSACLSAHDLHDFAPETLGDSYAGWYEDWIRSSEGYWAGQTEHLSFAWGEPDFTLWNPTSGQFETGWRLTSPSHCLKNRWPPATPTIPVQVQPEGRGPLLPASDVVFGRLDGELIVGKALTGEAFALDAVAAEIWDTVVDLGQVEGTAVSLAERYDVDLSTVRADVHRFVAEALDRELFLCLE